VGERPLVRREDATLEEPQPTASVTAQASATRVAPRCARATPASSSAISASMPQAFDGGHREGEPVLGRTAAATRTILSRMAEPAKTTATIADLIPLIAAGEPYELVDGQIVRKASPDTVHRSAQAKLVEQLGPVNVPTGGALAWAVTSFGPPILPSLGCMPYEHPSMTRR
jgi:hypothetical protein